MDSTQLNLAPVNLLSNVDMELVKGISTGLLAFIAYACFYRWVLHRNRRGPRIWPLLGTWLELNANKHHFYEWLQPYFDRFPTISIPSLSYHYVLSVDPANLEYVSKTNFNNYPKGELTHRLGEELFGDAIINVDGDLWKSQRKIGSYAFSPSVLRNSSTAASRDGAVRLCTTLARAAHSSEHLDMQDVFKRALLATTSRFPRARLGAEGENPDQLVAEQQFGDSLEVAGEIVAERFSNPLWRLQKLLRIGRERFLARHIKVVHDFALKMIRDRITKLQDGHPQAGVTLQDAQADVVARFVLDIEAKDGIVQGPKNWKSLRDIAIGFVVASHVTTATALTWFLYLVSSHPDVEEKILKELKEFESTFAPSSSGDPGPVDQATRICQYAHALTYEALSKMQYLHAAVSETVRLYPSVPLGARICHSDDTLPDGTRLKRGDMIAFVPYCMARTERLWGHDAAQFRPERWLKEGVFQHESPYKFSSFHAGPRICMGKDLAYIQMKMNAAILLRFYKFELVAGHNVRYDNTLILAVKGGLKMTVSERRT